MFRNETGATERRAKKASQKVTLPPKKRKDSSSSSSSFSSSSSDGQGVLKVTPREVLSPVVKGAIKSPLELSIIPAIKTPTDTKATCHFVSNFVLLPRQGGTRGFLDYLIPLMKKTTESSNSHLQYAFNACALASLGNRVRADSVDLHEKAYNEYSKALGSLNIALRNPEEAKSDAVLAAVLLLGMFEVGITITLAIRSLLSICCALADFAFNSTTEHDCEAIEGVCMGIAHRGGHPACQSQRPKAAED